MTENAPVRRSRKRLILWLATAAVLLVVVVGGVMYLRSARFEEVVRHRLVSVLEEVTGGKVELQSLHWRLSRLEIEANNLTVHGLEPAGQVPLLHLDRLYARVRVISFVDRQVNLRALRLDRPVVHLMVNADGSTNVPEPKVKTASDRGAVQQLFDLATNRAELRNGMLIMNERKLPLDFSASDVAADMNYARFDRRYDGSLHVGKLDVQVRSFRDIAATADAAFSLWQNRAEVRSLKLISQHSSVELSGTIDGFNHPRMQVNYGGTIDLAQAGEITRVYKLRGGGLNVSGSTTITEDNYSATGKLGVRGVDYEDAGLILRDASAAADFSLDRDHIQLKKINGRLLGGTVTGDAEVKNYAPALAVTSQQVRSDRPAKGAKPSATAATRSSGNTPNSKSTALPVQQGTANFKVSGASLADVLRMLSSKALPLDKLNAAGSVSGTVGVVWRESITRATADLALDASAPAQAETNQLPVSGTLHGRYDVHSGLLSIAQLNLATPRSEANASGDLGPTDAQLKLAVTTTSLQEFQPLLNAIGQSALPVELNGRASFNGTLSGKLDHPDIAGRLLATDFSYVYTPEAPPAATQQPTPLHTVESLLHLGQTPSEPKPVSLARRIHIDSFAGDVQYGRTEVALHNGVIEQGSAQLNVDGSATLEDGSFTAHTPFDVRAAIHNGSVTDLQRTIGTDYPVSGTVNFSVEATGTRNEAHGRGQLSLTGGEAYGHAIKTLTSDIVLANREAGFENIRLEALGGNVVGSAAYNLNTRQVRSDLRGDNIELEKVTELQSVRLQERGIASFTLKTSGTPDQPSDR